MEKLQIKLNRYQEYVLKTTKSIVVDDYLIVKEIGGYLVSKIVEEPFEIIFTDKESEED